MAETENELCEVEEVHEELLRIVNETMPKETELYDLAELFKVFGDSTRIRILFVLFEAEVCVCDLAQTLRMTQSAISHSRIRQTIYAWKFDGISCEIKGAAHEVHTQLLLRISAIPDSVSGC